MEIDSDTSDEYFVIITKKDRVKVFCKIYWRILTIVGAAIILLPILFIGSKNGNAYKCLYIFLLTMIYWIFDVLHPGIIALIPIAMSIVFGYTTSVVFTELQLRSSVLNCLGIMMTMVAIEYSRIHRRLAIKLLLVFGCSHYRLSFVLFFTSMLLSMVVANTMACGLMIPLVKAVLLELERMGILEMYHNIGKNRQTSSHHEASVPRPTDYTIFYFLGICYSSSIGGMVTLIGSETDEIFMHFYETIFPFAPKLQFPHIMLLNLPGVLVMESLLYLWMNFFFMGMFRAESEIALEIGMSEEEAQYIQTLLSTQYHLLGKIRIHEIVVATIIGLTIVLQATRIATNAHVSLSSPVMICALLYFILPVNLDFIKFFKKRSVHTPFPTKPSKSCLNWNLMMYNIEWTALLTVASSCIIFEALQTSQTVHEAEKLLLLLQSWPAPAQALAVLVLCKILTECASNSCVLHVILPSIAKLSVMGKVSPHYLMSAATLACSVPFHLATGTAANAMVLCYAHIPPWKMMHVGLGPSFIAIVAIWFTVTLWSRAVWQDVSSYPAWADSNTLFNLEDIIKKQTNIL